MNCVCVFSVKVTARDSVVSECLVQAIESFKPKTLQYGPSASNQKNYSIVPLLQSKDFPYQTGDKSLFKQRNTEVGEAALWLFCS